MGCPWVVRGLPLGCPWDVCGIPAGCHWPVCQWVVFSWAVCDLSMGCPRAARWLSVACPRTVRGLSVGYQAAHGPPPDHGRAVGCPWAVLGLCMGCPWVAHGRPIGCPWVACGLPMGCQGYGPREAVSGVCRWAVRKMLPGLSIGCPAHRLTHRLCLGLCTGCPWVVHQMGIKPIMDLSQIVSTSAFALLERLCTALVVLVVITISIRWCLQIQQGIWRWTHGYAFPVMWIIMYLQ